MATSKKADKKSEKKNDIIIVAGETSGEQYGALLTRELLKVVPKLSIAGVGGDAMKAEGIEILEHVKNMAVVGLTEALAKYRSLKKIFLEVLEEIEKRQPKVVVLIDYPGFNLRLARKLKEKNIPVVYYISPQIWAWHRSRVHSIGRDCDKILVIFDFEEDLYADEGYNATFVGHPLLDRLAEFDIKDLKKEFKIPKEKALIGLLPGSRRQEIERLLPVFLGAARLLLANNVPVEFVLPVAPLVDEESVSSVLSVYDDVPVKVLDGRSYDVMSSADLLFVASGTATLEAAVLGAPMVISYKTGTITYLVGKSVLNVDWLGLPNIIMNAEIVPELLQKNCNPEYLAQLAVNILSNPDAIAEIKENLEEVKKRLGGGGASARAAKEILSLAQLS